MGVNLGCALTLCTVIFFLFSIVNIFMGEWIGAGICLLVSAASFGILDYCYKSKIIGNGVNKDKSWMKKVYEDNNIDDFKMEFILKSALAQYPDKQLLYTKDKRLFCLEMHKRAKQIELSSILKVDVECITMERNRKRIVALTTTYDNVKSVVGLNIKIITGREVYNIELDPSPATIDKAQQCKLILDRDLKVLNQ